MNPPRAFLCIALLALACSRTSPDRELHVRRVEPAGGVLKLNQAIHVYFDKVLDRTSVTADTLRVLDEAGNAVPGRIRVGDWWLSFEPIPPRRPDLSDGSFIPGRSYRLQLSGFPKANAIRGRGGEILKTRLAHVFRIATSADLPPGAGTEFLPDLRGTAQFHPLLPVKALENGTVLELAFSRPLYPPSVRTEAFRLVRQLGMSTIAIKKVEILGRSGPSGAGTVLRLYPASALEPGIYSLFFESGSQGVLDYGGQELLVPSTIPGRRWTPGGWLPFAVEEQGLSFPFQVDLRRPQPSLATDPARVEFPVELQGGLEVSSVGLRFPDLRFVGFQSQGAFRAKDKMVLLAPENPLPGKKDKRPWDFDSFEVAEGCRLIVELDRDLDIRVTGTFSIRGELLFRLGGKARAEKRRHPGLLQGDPRPTWAEVHPRVRILVGGICRLQGVLGLYQEEESPAGLVPGYLWGRGPFFGNWANCGLQSWIQGPDPRSKRDKLRPDALMGRWGWLGAWVDLGQPRALAGELTLLGATEDLPLEIRVQGRHENGQLSSWVMPEVLPRLGRIRALRAALFVDGGSAETGPILQGMGIR